mmetsp:Transcript_42954/g.124216  ORF Transcript_42954/g.124216 Transcript_42954/m.124216 type:complete len:207 (+) Transcript_42954:804-1424(+)
MNITRSWKVLSEFVKRARHHAIGGVECFFDTIAVVNINVNVKNAFVLFQKLQNGENAIVDVTESRSLSFLSVVQTSGPVDDNVHSAIVQTGCTADRPRGVELTKLEKPIKNRAILSHIKSLKLTDVVLHVIWSDHLEKIDIVVAVKSRHGRRRHQPRTEDLHFPIQSIVHHQVVSHSDTMRFHRMPLPVMIISHLGIVEIGYAPGV